jgi:hypothetical protein
MTGTAKKKKRAKNQHIIEYTNKHGVRMKLPPEMTKIGTSVAWAMIFVERIGKKQKSSADASSGACHTINTLSF